MELCSHTIALYGRFSPGVREVFAAKIETAGGRVVRDLTRRADILVIGARADSLIESGALLNRLEVARNNRRAIFGESAFQAIIAAETLPMDATLPLASALQQSGATAEDAALLAAFDLVVLREDKCRFADMSVLRTAGELRSAGCDAVRLVRIIREANRSSPRGRHRVIMTASGAPALEWENGRTTLDGQGYLPLSEEGSSLEDLFERAMQSEADGDLEEAARLFDTCARGDRSDALALYNFGNIRLRQSRAEDAALAYQRALAREPDLSEARYNLALAHEARGRIEAAEDELRALLKLDPDHPDALFNLAQLTMNGERLEEAALLYERFLATGPDREWQAKARKAIAICRHKV